MEVINHDFIDAIAVGEPEYTFVDMCLKGMEATDGMWFKDRNGKIIKNPSRGYILQLDQLPYPARELADLSLYRSQVHIYRGRRAASMITSRGCPFGCSFCASFNTMGKRYRTHSPEYVLKEIKYLYETYHIRDIAFADDEFILDRKRTTEICNLLIGSNLDLGWYCFARVSDVDEALLVRMKKAGCYCINFGIESADERVLKNIGKKITPRQAERAITIANKLRIKTVAGYMFGNRGDTLETMKKTIDFACRVSPVIANFNIMVPFPGTRDYELLKARHPRIKDHWDDFTPVKVNRYLELDDASHEKLQHIISSAYIRFYFRPLQIITILKNTTGLREIMALAKGLIGVINQVLAWRR